VPIPILLETESLLIVDKPHGWLTTPARLADDPRPCLGRSLQKQVGAQIYPVHRLDFEVSGLTVWAKTAAAHRVAQGWFEHARVRKVYEAMTACAGVGVIGGDWEEWICKLERGKKRAFIAAHGKPAKTLARRVGGGGGVGAAEDALAPWELVAVTGRPHQLRFEMARHGCPIFGDVLYGGAPSPTPDWIALRAVELDLRGLDERLGLPEVVRVEAGTLLGQSCTDAQVSRS
jgi:tRNA pseudouridine32 synthase / 23S rRNA pseudouridine746 synthase